MNLSDAPRDFLTAATSLSSDAIHIYVGLTVLLLVLAIWKKPLSDWRPLAVVVLVSLAAPIWRFVDAYGHGGTPRWHADWRDVWNTLFWPAVLFVLARFTRIL